MIVEMCHINSNVNKHKFEICFTCKISSMSGITGSHHVLGIKHLSSQLWDSESSVLLRAACCQRSKARHEEVEPGEGDHVDRQLSEVSIELAREPETGGHTRHGDADQVVEVTIGLSLIHI